MKHPAFHIVPLLAVIVVAACAPSRPTTAPAGGPAAAPGEVRTTQPSRTLRVVIRAEPGSVAGTILIPTGISTTSQRRIFSAGPVLKDTDGVLRPYVAETVPQLNTDTWRVFPDGRMETTFRLKPNLTWHDDKALTAEDFVFARSVYSSPNFGISRGQPHGLMEDVSAPDSRTVVIRWREPFPEAADLGEQDFAPLPRHILESVYEREHENLDKQAFWTTDFVGAGPFQVARWEPGAFIEAAAFDGHALGRPKIDRLRITWNSDFNANLATLLAGEADMPLDDSIRVEQGLILEREWTARNAGTVQYRPDLPRFVQVQHRADYANPQAVRDVRVRKALAHAIDRDAINEALFQGKGLPSDSLVYPTIDGYAMIDAAAVHYPLDVRRTDQFMTEAGFSKVGGFWVNPAGARVNLEVRNIQSAQNDGERSIIADGWRRAGYEVKEDVFTPVQTQQGQVLGTFRALSITSAARSPQGLKPDDYHSRAASRPETRWFGQNRGGWSNAEYDRLIESWLTTLDRNESTRLLAEAVRVRTDDLGVIPLHFNPGAFAYATGIQGIRLKAPDTDVAWNIHEWEFR